MVNRSRTVNADGSMTETTNVDLTQVRPVRDDVVEAYDNVLSRAGEVMHAFDPARVASFQQGGPPVWSVGVVQVNGPTPFAYALTYGLSHVLSPEAFLEGIGYELSIALPGGMEAMNWGVPLLRHLSRYIISSGNELMAGDVMPCHAPLTRVPFQPHMHDSLPFSKTDSVIVVVDPLIPRIDTPHGAVEVRRIVGVDTPELQRLGPMSPAQRGPARAAVDPNLFTRV